MPTPMTPAQENRANQLARSCLDIRAHIDGNPNYHEPCAHDRLERLEEHLIVLLGDHFSGELEVDYSDGRLLIFDDVNPGPVCSFSHQS